MKVEHQFETQLKSNKDDAINSLDSMEVGLRTQISTEKLESIEMEIEGLQLNLEKERNRIKSEIKDLVHSKGFKELYDFTAPHLITRWSFKMTHFETFKLNPYTVRSKIQQKQNQSYLKSIQSLLQQWILLKLNAKKQFLKFKNDEEKNEEKNLIR